MTDKDFVPVDRQWRITDIDPHTIAHALRGELEESHVYYGRPRKALF